MKTIFSGFAVLAGLFVFGSAAHATSFTFNCDQSGSCSGANNFGSISLTQNGSNVDVLVTITAGYFVTTGNHHAFSFNITGAPAITVLNLSPANTFVVGGAGSNPPFGSFNYTIDCTICQGGQAPGGGTSLSFTVSKTGGGTLLVSDFATNGAGGFSFASDICITGLPAGAACTGAVGSNGDPSKNPAPTTPEPTSAVLLLSGLAGLIVLKRKFVTA